MLNIRNIHYMDIEFESVINHTKGRLYFIQLCGEYEICCDIEEFKGLHICDADMITSEDVFLGSKKSFEDLKVGDCISILENAVIIKEIDLQTNEEYNDECERIEMEDWIAFDKN